jgi:vesicle coat complex subunit
MSSLFAEAWLSLFSKDHYDFMKDFATAGNKPRADILIVRNSIHSSLCNLSKSKLLAAEQSKIAVQLNNSLTSATTSSPSKRHLECLTELLMFYMNGQSLEWAYLPIVTLAQTAQRVADKRLAYLLCCLLHSSTKQAADLPLALLNTIRKDLKHANEWVVQAALGAAMELNNADIAPALITDLQHNLLSHSRYSL